VKGLVESVAVEVAADGLTVNAVAPGGTVSSLAAGLLGDRDDLEAAYRMLASASSSGVPTTAEDIAAAALFLAGPSARRINGACLVVDGGDDVPAACSSWSSATTWFPRVLVVAHKAGPEGTRSNRQRTPLP